jgi:hypothetical protein
VVVVEVVQTLVVLSMELLILEAVEAQVLVVVAMAQVVQVLF